MDLGKFRTPSLALGLILALAATGPANAQKRGGPDEHRSPMLLIFAPWPGNLWGVHNTGPGNFTQGLIWDGPYTPVKVYVAKGDLPYFLEYHWTALQDLAGNAYILSGIALLILLAIVALRSRREGDRSLGDRDLPSDATAQTSTDGATGPTSTDDATAQTSTDAVARPACQARTA